jgi:RNA polymerase sigma-70 factor (ECF subfamily)
VAHRARLRELKDGLGLDHFEGRSAFLSTVAFRNGRTYRFVPTRANGAPAFGVYQRDPNGSGAHAIGLLAVTLAGGQIASLTRFDSAVLARFGLPRSLPDTGGRRRRRI